MITQPDLAILPVQDHSGDQISKSNTKISSFSELSNVAKLVTLLTTCKVEYIYP